MVIYYPKLEQAYSALDRFAPALRELHRIIPATISGQRVGWMVQFVNIKGKPRSKSPGHIDLNYLLYNA